MCSFTYLCHLGFREYFYKTKIQEFFSEIRNVFTIYHVCHNNAIHVGKLTNRIPLIRSNEGCSNLFWTSGPTSDTSRILLQGLAFKPNAIGQNLKKMFVELTVSIFLIRGIVRGSRRGSEKRTERELENILLLICQSGFENLIKSIGYISEISFKNWDFFHQKSARAIISYCLLKY